MSSPILKTIIASILLFIITAVSTSRADQSDIKIGVLLPLSGSLAGVGLTHMRGHEFAIEEINSAGGIHSLGGKKIRLIYADTRGDPILGIKETYKLIKGGSIALVGAYQSSVVHPTTEIAEEFHIPYLVTTALSDKITKRGFRFTFRPEASISDFIRDEYKFVEYLYKRDLTGKTIALLYEDSLFGQFSAILQRESARRYGLHIVADIAYSSTADNLSTHILQLKERKPDIVLQTSYLLDAIKIAKLMNDYDVKPPIIIATGAGPKDPEFIKELGNKSDYWFVVNEWNHNMAKDGVKYLNDRFKKKYGVDMDGIAAMCYVSTWLLKDALERAGSVDGESLRKALAETNITSGPASMIPLGNISFDEYGQSEFVTLITQIINGEHYAVWPPELATRAAVVRNKLNH